MELFGFGPGAMFLIMVVGVLLFGKNLPEIAKKVGLGIMEFKKGVSGIAEAGISEIAEPKQPKEEKLIATSEDIQEATSPKFEPPA